MTYTPKQNYRRIKDAEDKVERAARHLSTVVRDVLETSGWTIHCDLPGSYWLWRKTIDGQTVNVSEKMALEIESSIQSFYLFEEYNPFEDADP